MKDKIDWEEFDKSEAEAWEIEKYEKSGSEDSFGIWIVKKYVDERILQFAIAMIAH